MKLVQLRLALSLLSTNCFLYIIDVNECDLNTHDCDEHATCNNTIGSYECECNTGYSGDGNECTGIKINKYTRIYRETKTLLKIEKITCVLEIRVFVHVYLLFLPYFKLR